MRGLAAAALLACTAQRSPSEPPEPAKESATHNRGHADPEVSHTGDSLDDILDHPERYDGKRVHVAGSVMMVEAERRRRGDTWEYDLRYMACTLLECGDKGCCNSCGSVASLGTLRAHRGEAAPIALVGDGLGCGGNECDMKCNPPQDRPIEVFGTVELKQLEGDRYDVRLIVERYSPL